MSLLNAYRWIIRARYWRRRALKAEAEAADLQAQLTAELWRQVERGDMFTSAAVMGTRGMFGIAPRLGPATVKRDTPQQVATHDPLAGLTGIERMEFQTYWLPDAVAAGVSEANALNRFRAELAGRKSIRDEGAPN